MKNLWLLLFFVLCACSSNTNRKKTIDCVHRVLVHSDSCILGRPFLIALSDSILTVVDQNNEKMFTFCDDAFFKYSMATSKGTKMPRGDKASIMQYEVPNYDILKQRKIAKILRLLDKKIELNNAINNNLMA